MLTGLGVACPLGVGREAFWGAYLAPPAEPLSAPRVREGLVATPAVCFPKDFPAERYTDRRAVRKASEVARLAAAAGQLALDAAALPDGLRAETCVVLGTALGCSRYYLEFHEKLQRKGIKGANAVLFTESVFNAASAHVSRIHGLRGAAHTLAGGEDVGLAALAAGRDRLLLGAPAVLVGGAEQYADLVHASLLHEGRVGRALGLGDAPVAFGEGAALAVFEAEPRGSEAPLRLTATARTRAGRGTAEEALVRALRAVCAAAGIEPAALDLLVSAGATRGEVDAHVLALAGLGASPRTCAPKALLGEGFAFGSAATLVLGAQALATQTLPPTHAAALPPSWRASPEPEAVPLRRALLLAQSAHGSVSAALLEVAG
ncbi:MAG: beta-ketoacyl synthase N-terminal-like domain-containing protein [Planctomycetota bacterium]